MRLFRTSLAVIALTAGTIVVPTVSVSAAPQPVAPAVVTVAVPTLTASQRSAAGAGAPSALPGGRLLAAAVTRQGVDFDVAGVTFTGRAPTGLLIEARVHTASGWGGWKELDVDDDGPDATSAEGRRATPGTAPLIAAGSDGIDVRVSSPRGTVPAGLTTSLVDGGTSPADASTAAFPDAAAAAGSPASAPGPVASSVGAPAILTRAQWGADESLRDCEPTPLAGFKAAVVHHTVNSNSYSSTQAASLMRGIYAYHTKSLGWCDIGYNFLVDRFGRIYEGRKGGITGFVQGAQAGGFNEETFGVSVIGDFTYSPFPSAVTSAVTRTIAWQADRSSFDPSTSVLLTSSGNSKFDPGEQTVQPRVMGHRDLSLTSCPGNYAYPQLPSIRANATASWRAGQFTVGAARFVPVTSRRVLDTRLGVGAPKARLGSNRSLVLTVPGLPSNTTAVVLNVTATNATVDNTYLAAYPSLQARPTASIMSVSLQQTTAHQVIVGVSPGNSLRLYNSAGEVDLLADVQGYYTTTASLGFVATPPRRFVDTRVGLGLPAARLRAGTPVTFAVSGLPSTATAVSLNLTATGATADTYLTAYPAGQPRPGASALNVARGHTVANLVTLPVGPGGTVTVHSAKGEVNLIADLAGYYAPGIGSRYVALSPRRVLDTRLGFYAPLRQVAVGSTLSLAVPGIPSTATGVALTLTTARGAGGGSVLMWPTGSTRPDASTLNPELGRNISNFVMSALGTGQSVSTVNASASGLDLIADVSGYFIR